MFSLFAPLIALLSLRYFSLILIVVSSVFLIILPSTGFDYDHYKDAFDLSYLSNDFPWFYTSSYLTAEPLYKWYSSAIRLCFTSNFEIFLSINLLLCFCLSIFAFKKTKPGSLSLFWLYILPVIFPTIFYFSPRSSLSFFLVFIGLFFLVKNKKYLSYTLIALGITLHTQYIVQGLLIILYSLVQAKFQSSKGGKLIKLIFFLLILLGFLINGFLGVLLSFFSFIPHSEYIIYKIHYLTDAKEGFRLTSILSLVVYPAMVMNLEKKLGRHSTLFFIDKVEDKIFIDLLKFCVLTGMAINLIFFSLPHVSGRLSRFSDYISMGILIPIFLKQKIGTTMTVVCIFFVNLIAPLIYSTLYSSFD